MKALLRLFKALPVENKEVLASHEEDYEKFLSKTIRKGFVFSDEVIANYSEKELDEIIEQINISITPEEMNSSFHKSFSKVRDSHIGQLLIEQLFHYLTTYGYEAMNVEGETYIPSERLEIPEIEDDIRLIQIKGYTKDEIKEKLINLLRSGIALNENTINDVVDVALYTDIDGSDIEEINNKEVKANLYDYLDKIPDNPVEFLRFLIYKSIGSTLLIKNKETINCIKDEKNLDVLKLIEKYENKHGLENLAKIFYRFKPIWLAFKTNNKLNKKINKIRKLAKIYHEPMKEDFLNEITKKIKKEGDISYKQVENELKNKTIFRKIRLAYALNYRTLNDSNSILYKVRNGKSYAKEFSFEQKMKAKMVYDIVLNSIIEDISSNVKGQNIYIPENVKYAMPATEKQFTGDFPNGSCAIVPNDVVFGINWYNKTDKRVDLDLSLISKSTGKVGWDSSYRTDDRRILFSGDVTDANGDNGGSELFYVKRGESEKFILMVNYFNYSNDEVPFKVVVSNEQPKTLEKNYMVNPNNVSVTANTEMNKKQKILGLLVSTPDENRFYFSGEYLNNSITSQDDEHSEHAREYLFNFYENSISLNEVLIKAGANLVDNKRDADIDLSPENLEKDKIINLIDNKTKTKS